MENEKLNGLLSKLEKKKNEVGKLEAAITAEKKRMKEKERRDTEKWWRDVSREMEQIVRGIYGDAYKDTIEKELLIGFVRKGFEEMPRTQKQQCADQNGNGRGEQKDIYGGETACG